MIFKILCTSKDDALNLIKLFSEYGATATMYPQPIYRCSPPSALTSNIHGRVWEDYEVNVEFSLPGYYTDNPRKEDMEAFDKIYRNILEKHGKELRLLNAYTAIDSTYCVVNTTQPPMTEEDLQKLISSAP